MKSSLSRSLLGLLFSGIALVTAPGQDVHLVYVERGEFFTQASTNRPVQPLNHELFAWVLPTLSYSVLSASLAVPGISIFDLTHITSDRAFELLAENGTLLELTGPAPRGSYVFQVSTLNQGMQSFRISMPGPAVGIPPARFANFVEAQVIDASQPFTLKWDKILKRGPRDYLALYVYDTNGPSVFSVPSLSLDQTNAVIPAGSFQPNSTYVAYLYLRHYFAFTDTGTRLPPFTQALELRSTKFLLHTLNPAGFFKFGPNPIVAREDAGTATVTVERTQGTQGEVSVDYFTSDRSAQAGTNYSSTAGTLTFPDGVATQTFDVPLLNDGISNAPLKFQVTLTNASNGAGLIVRPHATVTILDSQSAPGTNVNVCELAFVEFYSQDDTNAPTQTDRSLTSRFFASIHPKFPGAVSNAVLQLPNGSTRGMANLNDFLEYNQDFPSRLTMNAVFHGGKYLFHFDTLTDGSFVLPVVLGAERNFYPAQLTDWTEAQTIDPAAPFTLQWNQFVGGTTNDFITLSIVNPDQEYVIRTPRAFESGAMNGTARSLMLPPKTLAYGETYFVNLGFVKVTSRKAIPPTGILGGTTTYRTTSFHIKTIAAPPP